MKLRFSVFLTVFTIFFVFFNISQAQDYNLPAPTILEVDTKIATPSHPIVKGVTFNNTLVKVYVDNEFVGDARVVNDSSGVASFSLAIKNNLSIGEHSVYTVAQSKDGLKKSGFSEKVFFTVPYPTPAPILLDPVVDEAGKIAIVGLAKNDLAVEIYIEGVLQVRFTPPPARTGTTNFWYKPGLPAGEYTVTARTIDNTGKPSISSKDVVLYVPKHPEILAKEEGEADMSKETTEPQNAVQEDNTEETDQAKDPAFKQSDEFTEKSVEELEEKLPEKPTVVKDKDNATKVVVEDKGSEEGVIKIEEPEQIGEIVLDTNEEDLEITTTETTTEGELLEKPKTTEDEEMIIFGETDDKIGDGASEEIEKTNTTADIQQKNRLTGFVILLIIAVILAIWYVREKKQIEILEKEQPKKDK